MDVGLAFPVVFYQDGEGALEGSAPSTFAIGDLRLHVKARMYKTKNGFFSLAFVPYFTFPTAKTTDDFTGSASLTAVPLLAASFDLKPLNLPDLRFGINAGYRFVKKVEIEDFIFDDEILLRVAASYQFYQDMFMAIAELNATTTATEAFQSLEHTPMEVIAGLRYFYKPFLHFNLGFSAGITPGYATPDVRVFAGAVITIPVKEAPVKEPEPAPPAVVDSDGDGLLDPDDDCPHAPEDMDQFEDEDGCPDDDNDSDGILDTQDACPNQPETVNQYEDEDGCPDSKAVIVEEKIVVMEKIYFAHGKSEILERSLPFLDETAELIKMHPEMMLIRIEGHTDSRGSHSYNMELSAARAKSVRNYLVKKGVEPERLTTKGFGWTRPIISPEKTEEEYEKNRRVEFIIVND